MAPGNSNRVKHEAGGKENQRAIGVTPVATCVERRREGRYGP